MDISIALAVYNNFDYTKRFYEHIRTIYPNVPLIITDGGSDDETKEWGRNINDPYTLFFGVEKKLNFSNNYNLAINLVKTKKLVLVHNDMVIGKNFLENLDKHINENTILSYTTIEPPIFSEDSRPGKIIKNFGSSFEDFDYDNFNLYVNKKNDDIIYDGASFFMSAYKKTFLDVGGFDGISFFPYFCEDDDFLIRAKLKGYKLKTISSSMAYHFVSKTSRYSEEFKNHTKEYEYNNNKNFIRKWGILVADFRDSKYYLFENFKFTKINTCLVSNNFESIIELEPYFDKVVTTCDMSLYINHEQKSTSVNLKEKFVNTIDGDLIFYCDEKIDRNTLKKILLLRKNFDKYNKGTYLIDNYKIIVK